MGKPRLVREANRLAARRALKKTNARRVLRKLKKLYPDDYKDRVIQYLKDIDFPYPVLGVWCLENPPKRDDTPREDYKPLKKIRYNGTLWTVCEVNGETWLENRKGDMVQV